MKGDRVLLHVSLIVLGALSGCSSRAVIQPRSEILREARRQGVKVLSPSQERDIFFKSERVNEHRLLTLLRKRATDPQRGSNYLFGPADEIQINVFDVPELNLTARVQESGFISLPLIGGIQAAGQSEAALRDQLRRRLAAYVKDPQISIFISNYGSQNVAVFGAVTKPGTYPLKKGSNSILELISEAGGVSERAGSYVNFIPAELSGISAENDVEARARLALASHQLQSFRASGIEIALDQVLGTGGGIPLEIPVRGGDMIVIPEAGKIMVEGEVEKAGAYDLGRQMTVLGALAAAGGITYAAKVDEVEVVRAAEGNKKAVLVLDLSKVATGEDTDVRLRNSDIVRVPSHAGRRLRQDTFETISKVINFGVGGSVNLAK